MLGAIMPAPFAQPSRRTRLPPMVHDAAAHLRRVSVVMMARVTAEKLATLSRCARTRPGSAPRMRSTRSGTPITPVEQTSTSSRRQPSVRATASAVAREAFIPSGPVEQLALPALTITARARPPVQHRCSRESNTGAALTKLVVKTPAAAQRTSATIRARSSAPAFFLRPQAVAEKRKPRGRRDGGIPSGEAGIFDRCARNDSLGRLLMRRAWPPASARAEGRASLGLARDERGRPWR